MVDPLPLLCTCFQWDLFFFFSHWVMSYSLQLHGLQHTRLPCPSLSPGVWANSCPLSQWCHPTISSTATPFSSCPKSFPESGYFSMNKFFTAGGQSIGDSLCLRIFSYFLLHVPVFSLKDLLIFLVCWFIGDVLLVFDCLRAHLSLNPKWWSFWVEYPHFFSFIT